MNELSVEFENCYGIKSLNHAFSFKEKNVNIVYAKNGSMKTSFASILEQYQKGTANSIKDRLFEENKPTKHVIKIDNTILDPIIEHKDIFVIKSFDESYFPENISKLLWRDEKKKREFDKINTEMSQIKDQFLHGILSYFKFIQTEEDVTGADIAKINIDVEDIKKLEDQLIDVFSGDETDFYTALTNISREIDFNNSPTYDPSLKYSILLSPVIVKFLEKDGNKGLINKYIKRYIELIKSSEYFNLKFNHQNAKKILNDLQKKYNYFVTNADNDKDKEALLRNGFNLLNSSGELDAKDYTGFEGEIDKFAKALSKDKEFSDILLKIDNKLTSGNKIEKHFRDYLVDNIGIMVDYRNDFKKIKSDLVLSYIIDKYTDNGASFKKIVSNLSILFKKREALLNTITKDENTIWHYAVQEFNDRFDVPFEVYIPEKDRRDSLINDAGINELEYRFCNSNNKSYCQDGDGEWVSKYRNQLNLGDDDTSVLSQGERRAFYLLNIIFEIKFRKYKKQNTLFIIDDIADSFDYKNKYAIIEYLKEVVDESDYFTVLIFTHNFDFFRTIHSRLGVGHANEKEGEKTRMYMVENNRDVKIENAQNMHILNPFKVWKDGVNKKIKYAIALIPMIRNIIEYTENTEEDDYIKLTHLLHKRNSNTVAKKTENITFDDLEKVFKNRLLKSCVEFNFKPTKKTVFEEILYIASGKGVGHEALGTLIEDKVIVAIAIRYVAEEFMRKTVTSIGADELEKIEVGGLFDKYKKDTKTDKSKIKLLQRVVILTPENIHLNSFMYEPILDMDIESLKKLYKNVTDELI